MNIANSAKILGVFPTPTYSHFKIGEVLCQELATKGHDVTVISPYKQKTPIKNYRDVELTGFVELAKEQLKDINIFDFGSMPHIVSVLFLYSMGKENIEMTYEHDNVKSLLASDEQFDLVILESFYNEGLQGFCYRYQVPCIIVGSSSSGQENNRYTGNIAPASYISALYVGYPPNMSFFQRLSNLLSQTLSELAFHLYAAPMYNTLMHKYFPDAPHLYDLIYNTSLVLVNSDPRLTPPVPLVPNVKEVGGLHISEVKKLPTDIQAFLDNNIDVIYFALGSNLKSKDLPADKMKAILSAFKKWGKPVLWKFEEELPEKLENVKIAKWLPQTAVLAHKNVKAFITHGGRLSMMESLYFGIPMIGIPIFAEQPYNIEQMRYAGYGVGLEFKGINEESFYNAIVEISSNPKYGNEAKMRSDAMRSKPMNAREEAVYWVEYVIKYDGAKHLRNSGINLAWYQLWMVDLILFLVALLVLKAILGYVLLRKCCKTKQCKKPKKKVN